MRSRPVILLIAALLNVAGSPMAWGTPTDAVAETATHEALPGSCHGETQAPDHPVAPDSMPCCDGGCYCAAPALSVPIVVETTRLPRPGVSAAFDTSALPANPLDDSLRPPIR